MPVRNRFNLKRHVDTSVSRCLDGDIPRDILSKVKLEQSVNKSKLLMSIASGLYQREEYDKTLEFISTYFAQFNLSDISLHNTIATCHMKLGRHQAAITSLSRVEQHGACKDVYSYRIESICYKAIGDPEACATSAAEGRGMSSSEEDKIAFLLEEGKALKQMERYEDLIQLYSVHVSLIEISANDDQKGFFFVEYLTALRRTEAYDEARAFYDQYFSYIEVEEPHIWIARQYVEVNEMDKAAASLERYINAGGDDKRRIIEVQIFIANAKRDTEKIRSLIREAAVEGAMPNNPAVLKVCGPYMPDLSKDIPPDELDLSERHWDACAPSNNAPWIERDIA